ncbi:uncharacterized protein LOC110991054 [Acanthaster planci]|uniref:Suppressor of cytokine signaling 7 n=1 Tax=Acanthaster planci TaxID=133434 RepID=A0A8B8A747_ACAPL|nr:uncharacterized protein LOC110991054 [Acanthaster planci]
MCAADLHYDGSKLIKCYHRSPMFSAFVDSTVQATMLSSKRSHKSQREMAPDSVSFFSKMRKSLSGKHYHRNNGGSFIDGTQIRSKSMTIPQMDLDTAIPYVRDSQVAKTRRSSYSSPATSHEENGKGVQPGLTAVPNGSMQVNGKVLNGTHAAMDVNANDAVKNDSLVETKQAEVSIFEKQGARPKMRKTLTPDESTKAFDESASFEHGKGGLEQGMLQALSSREPPSVEMAQPHFPAVEINCISCSVSRKEQSDTSSETSPGEKKATVQAPPQAPNSTEQPSEPAIKFFSQTSALPHWDPPLSTPEAFATVTLGCRTENPRPQLKSDENVEEIEPNSPPELHVGEANFEGQILTAAVLRSSHSSSDETEGYQTSCVSPAEISSTDLKYTGTRSSLPGSGQEEVNRESVSLLTCGDSSVQRSSAWNTDQTDSIRISDEASVTREENCIENDKLDALNNKGEIGPCNTLKDEWISEPKGIIDQTMRETIMDCVRAALVESATKAHSEGQTCKSDGGKHCSTCTCEKPKLHPLPPRGKHPNPTKSNLVLTNIPLDTQINVGGSPKSPRTPHIAMLVNSNELFPEVDTKATSLSEQDLHMILKWNDFSLQQKGPREKEGCKLPIESHYSETSKAMNASQLSAGQEKSQHVQLVADNSQCILGATGGSDSTSSRSKAPVVDRSSKPKELSELASSACAEEPPPLPPRLPTTKKPDPFAAYPIFDDEDDDFPTHEFLHELNMDIYTDPKTAIKSKSLPRNTVPSQQASPPELRAAKRGKSVNMRNRFSQIFKPGNKKKRHSTHGFPDRPLPDIPLNPRLPKTCGNARLNNTLFGTTTGDIVSQQAVKEGLLVENPSREEVDKAREQFAVSLRKISEYGWYWGPMSWDDAESRLENMPDGSFLVRDSSDDRHLLSLSFRAQGSTHHTRVEHHNGKFSFWSQPCSHGSASIVEFVEEAMRHSHSGRVLYFLRPRMPGYPPAAVQLLYPISRFQKARSLQHMCRFVIRKHVRLDHIDSLPLPRRLKDYLKEAQYYTQEDILH